MVGKKVSQRGAVLRVLNPNEVLSEKKAVKQIMERYGFSKAQALQGIKNAVVMDMKVHRSVYWTMGQWIVYLRLAATPAPINHQDFGTGPIKKGMNMDEYRLYMSELAAINATVIPPWEKKPVTQRPQRIAERVVDAVLDAGLQNSTFRTKYPRAYKELLRCRDGMITSITKEFDFPNLGTP